MAKVQFVQVFLVGTFSFLDLQLFSSKGHTTNLSIPDLSLPLFFSDKIQVTRIFGDEVPKVPQLAHGLASSEYDSVPLSPQLLGVV